MAVIQKDFNVMGLPMAISRNNPIPLDKTAVWYNLDLLKAYAESDPTAYVGQILGLVDATNRTATAYIITSVAGAFPASQSFIEVKALEVAMAIENGADEIDIVLNPGMMIAGHESEAASEVEVLREEAKDVVLKVIIESGALKTPELIRRASLVSMFAGADFVKTSTGKIDVAATPEAAFVMCHAIKDYYNLTGRKVGFKAAGGVKTPEDAALYYTIVEEVLGKEWLTTDLFRIGASSAANNLISAIEDKVVNYF